MARWLMWGWVTLARFRLLGHTSVYEAAGSFPFATKSWPSVARLMVCIWVSMKERSRVVWMLFVICRGLGASDCKTEVSKRQVLMRRSNKGLIPHDSHPVL